MQLPLTIVNIKRNIFEKNFSAFTICHSDTTVSLNAPFLSMENILAMHLITYPASFSDIGYMLLLEHTRL